MSDERLVTVSIPVYDRAHGLISYWDDDTELKVQVRDKPPPVVVVEGNAAGLRSLARHLLVLAEGPKPHHLDFDNYMGWLGEGSLDLRLESY